MGQFYIQMVFEGCSKTIIFFLLGKDIKSHTYLKHGPVLAQKVHGGLQHSCAHHVGLWVVDEVALDASTEGLVDIEELTDGLAEQSVVEGLVEVLDDAIKLGDVDDL